MENTFKGYADSVRDKVVDEPENATAELVKLRREFDEFKTDVVRTAMAAAHEHEWCDEVQRVLRDLGLDPKRANRKVSGELVLIMPFTRSLAPGQRLGDYAPLPGDHRRAGLLEILGLPPATPIHVSVRAVEDEGDSFD